MFTLLYRSDAVALLPFSALADICIKSAARNRRLGITGFLVEHEGTFLQVLEGEETAVNDLYITLTRDPRHRNLTVLGFGERPGRSFGFWAMNFGPLDDPAFWDGEFASLRDAGTFRQSSYDPETAFAVLRRAYEFAGRVAGSDPVLHDVVTGGRPARQWPLPV